MRLVAISGLKIPKKEPKSNPNSNMGLAPKRACWHSWSVDQHMASADWPKCLARPVSFLIKIKPIFFDFLEIRHVPFRIWSNLAYFLSTPTSINRGKRSELRALLFWLLCSPYVKDVLEAFALRTSFW